LAFKKVKKEAQTTANIIINKITVKMHQICQMISQEQLGLVQKILTNSLKWRKLKPKLSKTNKLIDLQSLKNDLNLIILN